MTSVGVIGHGAFGQFIARLLRAQGEGIVVKIFSRRTAPDGVSFFSFDDVAQCDFVVLAVPIHVFEETLEAVVPLMRDEGIIVDVATVKVYTTELLKKHAGAKRFVATHPMFGPESYEKRGSLKGCNLVITDSTLDEERLAQLKSLGETLGLTIRHMTSDEHDLLLAHTLFFTHLTAQIAVGAGITRTAIDTLSFSSLMDAVESVKGDTALFRDVYTYNPHCKAVLDAFHESADRIVNEVLETDSV